MGYFYLFLNYFLHTTYASASFLIVVLAIIYGLRIKDPSIRIYAFVLALIKPLHTIAHKVDASPDNVLSVGIGFLEPHLFFHRLLEPRFAGSIDFSATNLSILLSLFAGIGIIVFYRFFHLRIFFQRACQEKSISVEEDSDIGIILKRHVHAMGIAKPCIRFSENMRFLSFTYGIRKAKIVINKNMFDLLDPGEKETLLLHELAHIKRKDLRFNLLHILLLDLTFYNPLSHFAYHYIKHEQEKDCDRLAVKYSGRSPQEVARNILNVTLKIKKSASGSLKKAPAPASAFFIKKRIGTNIFKRRIYSVVRTQNSKTEAKKATKIVLYILFAILMFF